MPTLSFRRTLALAALAGLTWLGGGSRPARADNPAANSSGVDATGYRPAFDAESLMSLEAGTLMAAHDLSLKLLTSFARAPMQLAIPGIGDTAADPVLSYLTVMHLTLGLSLHERVQVGIDLGAYRTDPDAGFGVRGRYDSEMSTPSTGLLALRPLSNLDAGTGTGIAGALDARAGIKIGLFASPTINVAASAVASLPFGEDEMFLGDAGFVFEPRLAVDYQLGRTRFTGNGGLKIRQRTVLESYDAATQTMDDAQIVLDVGSEVVLGGGVSHDLSKRLTVGLEATALLPLPGTFVYGECLLSDGTPCEFIESTDYFEGAGEGDLSVAANAMLRWRVNGQVAVNAMAGATPVGARGDDFHVLLGATWSPQPEGESALGGGDQDGDRIPDSLDGCPENAEDVDGDADDDGCPDVDGDGDGIAEPDDKCVEAAEDFDQYQDSDGCPERDNDGDGVDDTVDTCASEREDFDSFQDTDGCPDPDNDGDGFPDAADACPNEAETVNGVDDTDGCAERNAQLPQAQGNRIDLNGGTVGFVARTTKLTPKAKQVLQQVATIIKANPISVRVEVHVALGTKATAAGKIKQQKSKDKMLAVQRAIVVLQFLVAQGVNGDQLQAVGIGAEQPLADKPAQDAANNRVEFVKTEKNP